MKKLFFCKKLIFGSKLIQLKRTKWIILLKVTFFYVQATAWHSCCCHKFCLFKFLDSCKRLSHNLGNCKVLKWITLQTTTTSDRIHLLLDVPVAAINYIYSSLWRLAKCFSPFRELCSVLKCITLWTTTTSDRIHHLYIRKRKPYKTLNILTIER